MTTQVQKQRSKTLDILLEALAPDFDKLQPKVNAVFEQGREEGFTDMEIGDLVRSKMEEHYSSSTIKRVLPDTAKHQEKVRNQNFAPKMSANELELIEVPPDKISVRKLGKSITEGFAKDVSQNADVVKDHQKSEDNDLQITPQNSEQTKPQPKFTTLKQPEPRVVSGRHSIAPEEYKLQIFRGNSTTKK